MAQATEHLAHRRCRPTDDRTNALRSIARAEAHRQDLGFRFGTEPPRLAVGSRGMVA